MKVVGYSQPQVKASPAPKAENGGDAELAQVAEKKPRVIFYNVIDKKGEK